MSDSCETEAGLDAFTSAPLATTPRERVVIELMGIYAPFLPSSYTLQQWLADADAVLRAAEPEADL